MRAQNDAAKTAGSALKGGAVALVLWLLLVTIRGASAQTDVLPPVCFGDCSQDGRVEISDLVLLVNIALGSAPVSACAGLSKVPSVADIIFAVNNVLAGCPVSFTYQLLEGSSIIISQGQSSPPPTPLPLTGQFTVTVATRLPPNTLIGLNLMRIAITAPGVSVSEGDLTAIGCSFPHEFAYGCISAATISSPPYTAVTASLAINNQVVELFGTGPYEGDPHLPPYDGTTPPPPVSDLEICGRTMPAPVQCDDIRSGAVAGYFVTLFASPVGGPD